MRISNFVFIQKEDPVLSAVAPVNVAPLAVKRTPLLGKRPSRITKSKPSTLINVKRAVCRIREPLLEILSDDDNSSEEEIQPYSKRTKAVPKSGLKSAKSSTAASNNRDCCML